MQLHQLLLLLRLAPCLKLLLLLLPPYKLLGPVRGSSSGVLTPVQQQY
jgi:hypothetical protein